MLNEVKHLAKSLARGPSYRQDNQYQLTNTQQRSHHSLVARRLTIMGFQVEKSPARMCLRASPTSQR